MNACSGAKEELVDAKLGGNRVCGPHQSRPEEAKTAAFI